MTTLGAKLLSEKELYIVMFMNRYNKTKYEKGVYSKYDTGVC